MNDIERAQRERDLWPLDWASFNHAARQWDESKSVLVFGLVTTRLVADRITLVKRVSGGILRG